MSGSDWVQNTNTKGYNYYRKKDGTEIQWNKPNNTIIPAGWNRQVEKGVVVYKKGSETVYNKPGANGKPRKIHYWKNTSGKIINDVDKIPKNDSYSVEAPAKKLQAHPQPQPQPQLEGFCGINNKINGCYMNATIQLLNDIPTLRNLLLNKLNQNIIDELKPTSDCKTEQRNNKEIIDVKKDAIQALQVIFNKIKKSEGKTISVIPEYNKLLASGPSLQSGKQEDAAELYRKLIEAFICFETNTDIKSYLDSINFYIIEKFTCEGKLDNPVISDRFLTLGKLDISKLDPLKTLDISPNNESSTIQNLINEYLKVETLGEGNNLLQICGDGSSESRGKTLSKTQEIIIPETLDTLIITLKRFDNILKKISTQITPDNIITINKVNFKLKGCIRHHGTTLKSGHYTYVAFDENGKEAFIMDDTQVLTNDTRDTSKDGYIYLYERIREATSTSGGKRRKTQRRRQRRVNKSRKNRVYRK